MTEQGRVVGTAGNYLTFIAALRQRLTGDLGLTYETLDVLGGWAPTYSTKILGLEPSTPKDGNGWRPSARGLGAMSFDALLGLAAVRIVLVEDTAALERLQRHRDFVPRKRPIRTDGSHSYVVHRVTRDFLRQIARSGGVSRWAGVSAKRRTAITRKAARARWARQAKTITPKSSATLPA